MTTAAPQPQPVKPSGLDFSTLGNELTYWLGHIGQYFKGGYSGSGENGVDITLPQDTPVYAFTSGTVKGSGYYGGGGVVSIRAQPGTVWYYQHLDQTVVNAGDTVQAGQLIGYSGGQNSGGNHPSTPFYSSWPHIEVGINAPWGGIWGGGEGPNVNPLPYLQQLAPGLSSYMTLSNQSLPNGVGNNQGPILNVNLPGFQAVSDAATTVGNFFATIASWFNPPTRALKFGVGLGLMAISLIVVFLPDIAAGAASATGNPEVGAAILSTQKGPRGVIGAGIRSAGTAAGRQRTATKQAAIAQRAQQTVRLNNVRAAERAQALQLERAQTTARRAATTSRLNANVQSYNARGAPSGPVVTSSSTGGPPPSTSKNEYSPRVNSGKAGFGGFGFETPTKKPRRVPKPKQPTALPTTPELTPEKVKGYRKANPEGIKIQRTDLAPPAPDAMTTEQIDAISHGFKAAGETPEQTGKRLDRNYRQRFLRSLRKATDRIRRGEQP